MPEESKIENPRERAENGSDQEIESSGSERLFDEVDAGDVRSDDTRSRPVEDVAVEADSEELPSLSPELSEKLSAYFPEAGAELPGADELSGLLDRAKEPLGLEYAQGADHMGKFEKQTVTGQQGVSETQIYEDGTGVARVGGKEIPLDFSSAEKIYRATREPLSGEDGQVISSVTGDDLPNEHFSRIDMMATGTQRVELSNGDVIHRPPPNPDGVKWIRDIGGTDGDRSVIAYTDGRRELRFSGQGPEGVRSVSYDSEGKIIALDRDKPQGIEMGQSAQFERPHSINSYEGAEPYGQIEQDVDIETGAVTTRFPDSTGKLESIIYRPGEEEPYEVTFKPGQEDEALAEKIKSGEFKIPVNFQAQGDGPESINLFPDKWSSLEPVKSGDGSASVTPEGRVEFEFDNSDADGRTRLIQYPEGDPQNRIERTEYDSTKREDGLRSSTLVRGRDGSVREVKDHVDAPGEEVEDLPEKLEGEKRDFEHGSEKGSLYIDEATGYLNGIKFEGGNRAGQEYRFSHDQSGNLTGMEVTVPGESGESSQVSLRRDAENNWTISPAEAGIPGFENLQVGEGGIVNGSLKVKANGDIVYDTGEGNIETMRINGTHDRYDMNSYERIRESADGKSETNYWDGYEWRSGSKSENQDGTTSVTFEGEGKVRQIIRDARKGEGEDAVRSDRVVVVRNDGTVFDADWSARQMTRSRGEQKVDLFDSGARNEDGKPIWMHGQRLDSGLVRFQPTSEAEQQGIASGRLPLGVEFHESGSITSHYGNGAKVRSDSRGRIDRIDYAGGENITVERDGYGQVMRFSDLSGRNYERERRLPASEDGKEFTRWNILDGESKGEHLDAALTLGHDGMLSLEQGNEETLSIERNGRIVTRRGEQIVQVRDSQGQIWVQEERGETGSSDADSDSDPDSRSDKPSIWTVSSNGKSSTFEGELELVPDNGRVVIRDGEGGRHGIEPDGARTTYNKDGVETERAYEDGTAITRSDLGFLNEIKFKGPDGEMMTRSFVYQKGSDGVLRFVGTTLNGKPDEAVVDGALRELKNGAGFDNVKPEDLGAYIDYDDRTGLKSIRQSKDVESKSKAIKYVDIHGRVEERNENGEIIER